MDSKFAKFLQDNKIDARRVLVASHKIERLTPADRRLKLERRQAKRIEAAGTPAAEPAKKPAKPRSGRPVTERLLREASQGKALTGTGKTRLLRAVNRVLEQKKKPPVELKTLF
jgi:hypothetical protein